MTDSKPQNAQDEREKFQQMTLLTLKKFSVFCMNTNWEPVEVTDEPVDIVQPLFERICQVNIADELCSELRTAKSEGKVKCYEITLQDCFICEEALYQHESLWVSVNNELILKLIQEVHVLSSGEHKGINQTVKLIKRYYHWSSMQRIVNQYIQNCYECKQSKSSKDQKNELLNSLLISEQRWVDISMDFITGLLTTKDRKNAILNVMNYLSKEYYYIACTSDNNGTTTEETLKMLIHWVYQLHSMSASIVSDRGPQFVSTMWKSFCKRMGIQVNLSTAFHPETDSQTEQVNQDVETFLQAYINENQDDWNTWLPMAEFADNNADSAAITLSPFFMNHGFHLWMSFEPDLTSYEATRQCLQARSAGELTVKMNEILAFTKQHLAEAQKAMSRQINKHWKNVDYEVRDMVFLDSRNIKT